MSTFYLLPPQDEFGRRVAAYLKTWFPGAHFDPQQLAELVVSAVEAAPEVVSVFANDLPDERGRQLEPLLCEGFGAEPQDRVVDVRRGPLEAQGLLDTWVVRDVARPTPLRKVC